MSAFALFTLLVLHLTNRALEPIEYVYVIERTHETVNETN